MVKAKKGDKVRVHYTGRFEGGDIFDSSECDEHGCDCGVSPLEFVIGNGEVIPGFEKAIIGMKVGETKSVIIPVDDAYGKRNEEMIVSIDRSDVPEDISPEVGMHLELAQDDGNVFPVVITEVSDTHVTLDANHPLAGLELTFDLRLVEIC